MNTNHAHGYSTPFERLAAMHAMHAMHAISASDPAGIPVEPGTELVPLTFDELMEVMAEQEEPDAELPRLPMDGMGELQQVGIDLELAAAEVFDYDDGCDLGSVALDTADRMTPVYTADLCDLARRYPFIMEDAMREGLVDTGAGYTYTGHLMSAAYLFIENTIIDHFADFLIEVARQALKKNGQTATVSRWAEYCEWCRACLASETTVGELKEQIELAARH